ncbi:glycosyltransferase [Desulfobacula sp.]|uniref:Glycosyltransferase n=1 Tax=Candidatus Desulfatibia vada TaxID=2841696 RepID=A0A8J6P3C7_9BACT|nr:glycosyltransferase [Candidatus Desulfatibia vada]MBL6996623.1 glycosyltransferase [Desulfobacula sp.]
MRIMILISVVGKVKRGGESSLIGLVSFLRKYAEIHVISGGPFPHDKVTNLGFPVMPKYTALYSGLPPFMRNRFIRRMHLDPLSVRNLFFCKHAVRVIRKQPPDLIVFRSVGPWGAKIGRYLRNAYKIPFVSIEGGWKTGERETARYGPNLHISVNINVADYLKKQLPGVEVVYIPNGISVANFDPEGPKARVDLPRPMFLGCGAMYKFKRFHLAIEAVSLLGKGTLLLLGKGSEEPYLQQFGKARLGHRFKMTSVPYDEMPSFYRAADILTLPSSGESFGMAYIEAMACNTPVVATNDRNRKIIVGNGGKLIDPEDIPAYATALDQACKTDYGERPRHQAERFDWAIIGPKYLQAFEETVIRSKRNLRDFPVYRRMSKKRRN